MTVTIAQIKELREATAAGMGACKEALIATNGDMQEAIKYLREKGLAVAAKRVDKESKEGIIALASAADGKTLALAEAFSILLQFFNERQSYAKLCFSLIESCLLTSHEHAEKSYSLVILADL